MDLERGFPMKRLTVFFLTAVFCLVAAGCSSGASAPQGRTNAVSPSSAAEHSADAAGLTDGTQKAAASGAERPASDSRKVIQSAELTLQTVRYDELNDKLQSLVASFGGYIENSSVQGDVPGSNALRNASYTLRVPSGKLQSFLQSAGDLGNVVSKSISGQDVTQNYFDAETRVKSLRTEQDRLLSLMQAAEKMDDILKIEQRLTDVENEIEQLTGQLKQWDSLVSLSTVTIKIREVAELTAPPAKDFGGQIGSIFQSSLSALGVTLRYLVLGVAAALPFLAVLAVFGAAVLFLRRRLQKRKTRSVPPYDSGKSDSSNTK